MSQKDYKCKYSKYRHEFIGHDVPAIYPMCKNSTSDCKKI